MKMKFKNHGMARVAGISAAVAALAGPVMAQIPNHDVEGIRGVLGVEKMDSGIVIGATRTFDFTAKPGFISTGDGNSIYCWGYADTGATGTGRMQYPGPTMIVNQGDKVIVHLHNELPVSTSVLFPGQTASRAIGGEAGVLTPVVPAKDGDTVSTVTYSFVAGRAGTYQYHSGNSMEIQTEMGLVGALIVRPDGFDAMSDTGDRRAYDDMDPDGNGPAQPDSAYDHEYLFFLTEMDEVIHDTIEAEVRAGQPVEVDMSTYFPVYWFQNGRTGPDTMLDSGASTPWLTTQPYNSMPRMHPGQRVLMRVVGAGRDPHPLHHHGNHARLIARDGNLLTSDPIGFSKGADLAEYKFTEGSFPGTTMDAIFTWTGEGLGWDMYGHKEGDPMEPYEYGPDHGKAIPTVLPSEMHTTYGQMYGGSPFLGSAGVMAPGEGGFNPNNGFMYMWHSHNEKEIVNNDIFPGGMMTFMLIEAWPAGYQP
jgi:hypothetical protein